VKPATPNTGGGSEAVVSLGVHVVLVLSGVSALLYQVIWQRALLVIYGTNIESVAMVVSAFLVGLGLGSLAGGALSQQPGVPLVRLFSAAELVIGLYGFGSLRLFQWVGQHTARAGTVETGLLAFGLVFVPTLLMGATLPLLVAYRVRITAQVGRSVSWLYGANTLGGALGAFLGAFLILGQFGLADAARFAAALNVLVALTVMGLARRRRTVA
jgi:predicted membrane-bound spermidine synthase